MALTLLEQRRSYLRELERKKRIRYGLKPAQGTVTTSPAPAKRPATTRTATTTIQNMNRTDRAKATGIKNEVRTVQGNKVVSEPKQPASLSSMLQSSGVNVLKSEPKRAQYNKDFKPSIEYLRDSKTGKMKQDVSLGDMLLLVRQVPKDGRPFTDKDVEEAILKPRSSPMYSPYYSLTYSGNDELAKKLLGKDTFDESDFFSPEALADYDLLEWNPSNQSPKAPTTRGARSTPEYQRAYKRWNMQGDFEEYKKAVAEQPNLNKQLAELALAFPEKSEREIIDMVDYTVTDDNGNPALRTIEDFRESAKKRTYKFTYGGDLFIDDEPMMAVVRAARNGEDVSQPKDYLYLDISKRQNNLQAAMQLDQKAPPPVKPQQAKQGANPLVGAAQSVAGTAWNMNGPVLHVGGIADYAIRNGMPLTGPQQTKNPLEQSVNTTGYVDLRDPSIKEDQWAYLLQSGLASQEQADAIIAGRKQSVQPESTGMTPARAETQSTSMPDSKMNKEELVAYRDTLQQQLDKLDAEEQAEANKPAPYNRGNPETRRARNEARAKIMEEMSMVYDGIVSVGAASAQSVAQQASQQQPVAAPVETAEQRTVRLMTTNIDEIGANITDLNVNARTAYDQYKQLDDEVKSLQSMALPTDHPAYQQTQDAIAQASMERDALVKRYANQGIDITSSNGLTTAVIRQKKDLLDAAYVQYSSLPAVDPQFIQSASAGMALKNPNPDMGGMDFTGAALAKPGTNVGGFTLGYDMNGQTNTGVYREGDLSPKGIQNPATYAKDNQTVISASVFLGNERRPEIVKLYNMGFMSDGEVQIYSGLLADPRYGADKADLYYQSIEDQLKMRQGEGMAGAMKGNAAAQIGFAALAGMGTAMQGIAQVGSAEPRKFNAGQYAGMMVRDSLKENGPKLPDALGGGSLGQAAYDVSFTIGNMVPAIAANAVVPGIGPAVIGASAGGNVYQQSVMEGHSVDEAARYAVLNGVSEAFLETFLGTGVTGGKKLFSMIGKKAATAMEGAFKTALKGLSTSMISNGTEEYMQDVLQPVFETIAYGTEFQGLNLTDPQAVRSGVLGALVAVIGDSPKIAADIAGRPNVPPQAVIQQIEEATPEAEQVEPSMEEPAQPELTQDNIAQAETTARQTAYDFSMDDNNQTPLMERIQKQLESLDQQLKDSVKQEQDARTKAIEIELKNAELLDAVANGEIEAQKVQKQIVKNMEQVKQYRSASDFFRQQRVALAFAQKEAGQAKSEAQGQQYQEAYQLELNKQLMQMQQSLKDKQAASNAERMAEPVGPPPLENAANTGSADNGAQTTESEPSMPSDPAQPNTQLTGSVAQMEPGVAARHDVVTPTASGMDQLQPGVAANQPTPVATNSEPVRNVSVAARPKQTTPNGSGVSMMKPGIASTAPGNEYAWAGAATQARWLKEDAEREAEEKKDSTERKKWLKANGGIEADGEVRTLRAAISAVRKMGWNEDYEAIEEQVKEALKKGDYWVVGDGSSGNKYNVSIGWIEGTDKVPDSYNWSVTFEGEYADDARKFAARYKAENASKPNSGSTAQMQPGVGAKQMQPAPSQGAAQAPVAVPGRTAAQVGSTAPIASGEAVAAPAKPAENGTSMMRSGVALSPYPATIAATGKTMQRVSRTANELYKAVGVVYTSKKKSAQLVKMAQGMYEEHPGVVVTKTHQDINVYAHELGHAIFSRAKAFNADGSPAPEWSADVNAMVGNLTSGFKTLYPQAEWGKEAVAHFVNLYLIDKNAAENFSSPGFVRRFEQKLLTPKQLKAMGDARIKFRAALNADLLENYRARVVSRENIKVEHAPKMRTFIQGLADRYHSALMFDNAAFRAGYDNRSPENRLHTVFSNTALSDTRAANILVQDLVDPYGNIIGPSLKDELAGIDASEMHDFGVYLLALHDVDRQKKGKSIFGGYTGKDSLTVATQLEAAYPHFKDGAQRFRGWLDSFTDAWIIEPNTVENAAETFEQFRFDYPNYVPSNRVMADDMDAFKESFGDMNGAIGRAKIKLYGATGSDRAVISPIEAVVGRVIDVVAATQKELAKRKLLEIYQVTPGLGEWVREVEDGSSGKEQTLRILDRNGKPHYFQVTDKLFYDMLFKDDFPDLGSGWMVLGELSTAFKSLVTTFNPEFIKTNASRDFGEAFVKGSTSNPAKFIADWIKAIGQLTVSNMPKWMGGRTPEAVRLYYAAGGGDSSIAPRTASALRHMQRSMYSGYMSNAFSRMVHGQTFAERMKGFGSATAGIATKATAPIRNVNAVVEGAQRLAEFTRTLDKTGSPMAAISAAQEVTLNYRRGGQWDAMRKVNILYTFSNAGIQSAYGLYKMANDAKFDGKLFASRMTKAGAMFVLIPLLQSAIMSMLGDEDDKEAYEATPENVKSDNVLIPLSLYGLKAADKTSRDRFLKFQKARSPLSSIGDAFGRSLVEAIQKSGTWEAFAQYGLGDWAKESAVSVASSMNPYNSPIYGPLLQIAMNRPWYAEDSSEVIEPKYMRDVNLAPRNRVSDTTSSAAIWLVDHLGLGNAVSPIQMDYFINQSFGVLGKYATGEAGNAALAALSGGKSDYKVGRTTAERIRRTITTDPVAANDVTSSVYDLDLLLRGIVADSESNGDKYIRLNPGLSEPEQKAAAMLAKAFTTKGGLIYEAKRRTSRYYDQIGEIQAGDKTDWDKETAIRAIKWRIIQENTVTFKETEDRFIKKYIKGTPEIYKRIYGKQ